MSMELNQFVNIRFIVQSYPASLSHMVSGLSVWNINMLKSFNKDLLILKFLTNKRDCAVNTWLS